MTLELGTSPQASGSARLRLGSTDVMVAVRADIGTPPAGFPNARPPACAVELSASADPAYEGRDDGPPSFPAPWSAACWALPRAARASLSAAASGGGGSSDHGAGAALAMESLGIQKGKSCWVLRCDCLVLSADGAALDALSVAIKAALADCKIPKVTAVAGPNHGDPTELELDDDPEQCARLDVSRVPLVATVTRFGTRNVVDATRDESALGDYALAVAVDKEGNVRGVSTMSTSDGKSVDVSSLRAMTKAARDVARRMHAATDAFLVAAVSRAEDEEDDEDDGA